MKIGDNIYNINKNEIGSKEELMAIYDSRQSFYKKAFVLYLNNGDIALQSYDTIVAIIHNDGTIEKGKFSQTTSRHIKEFIKQFDDNTDVHDIIDYKII